MRNFICLILLCVFFESKSQEIITFFPTDIIIENEVLVPVKLKNSGDYDKLLDLADSIVFQEGTRRYIDLQIGKEYIDFQTDQQIILFDRFNDIIGIGTFSHFEHYDEGSGMGYTFFSATFKITGKKVESNDFRYCVNNAALKYVDNNIKLKAINPFSTPQLKKQRLDYNLTFEDYTSYSNSKDSAKIAVISVETTKIGDENESFKHVIYSEVNNQYLKVFEKDTGPWNISNTCVTKFMYNSKPIIICEIAIPNSDLFSFYVLIWNDNGYTIM